jgi:hypothetical protein
MGELWIASIFEGVELRQQRAFGAELRELCAESSSRVGRETRPPFLRSFGGEEFAERWRPYQSWTSVLFRTELEDRTREISRGK